MRSSLSLQVDSNAMRRVDGFVTEFARGVGITAEEAHRVMIMLEELLTNLMKYGHPDQRGPGHADIALELSGSRLEIEFADDGRAFDPFTVPAANLNDSIEKGTVGGLGLQILQSLCDETSYERRNNSNVVRLIRFIA
jgi:anti-sigma regulatory factor (Ser/Thr protein kinase)